MDKRERQAIARQQQLAINEQRLQKHAMVARALRDPALAPAVIASAKKQISLWQEKQLCSLDYIDAWSNLLADPLKAALVLEDSSPFSIQMRQNAPFVSFIRQVNLHAA